MPGLRMGALCRMLSPSRDSILITSAPSSPRICVAYGPMITGVRSITLPPSSGPLTSCERGFLLRFLSSAAPADHHRAGSDPHFVDPAAGFRRVHIHILVHCSSPLGLDGDRPE